MGRRLTPAERAARRKEEDRERRRQAREAEERRRKMAERKERSIRQAQDAAKAEFDEWKQVEDGITRLAVPKYRVGNARKRVEKGLNRRPFEPQQFVPEPFEEGRFSLMEPTGPSAPLVEQVRFEAFARLEQEFKQNPGIGRAMHALAWVGGAAGLVFLVMALRSASESEPFAKWLIAGAILVGALILGLTGSRMKRAQKERLWSSIGADATARAERLFRDAEAIRHLDFKNRNALALKEFHAVEASRLAQHDKREDARVAAVQGRLSGDIKALRRWLDHWIDKTSELIEAHFELTGTVVNGTRVDLAFLAPDEDELPQQMARLTKSGVSYRDRNDRELNEQYRHVVNALALRLGAEVLSRCPTIEEVRIDGYEDRIDEGRGTPYLACVLSFVARRSDLVEIGDWDEIRPEATIQEFGGSSVWKKGEFLEQEAVTDLKIGQRDDFEKDASQWTRHPGAFENTASFDPTGTWATEYSSDDEPVKARIEFVLRDGEVVGQYGKDATIRGVLSGRELDGQWQEGADRGRLRLQFAENGREFEGTWDVERSFKNGGSWKGARKI